MSTMFCSRIATVATRRTDAYAAHVRECAGPPSLILAVRRGGTGCWSAVICEPASGPSTIAGCPSRAAGHPGPGR
jgi:hypothetical protein